MIKNILMVCTGNTCRSPMAKALLEDMIEKDPVLSKAGIEVLSAGVEQPVFDEATAEAIEAMRDYGLDLGSHRSQRLSDRLVERADLILVMESWHQKTISATFPQCDGKIHLMKEYVGDSGEVEDPYCEGMEVYKKCAADLKNLLLDVVDNIKADAASA